MRFKNIAQWYSVTVLYATLDLSTCTKEQLKTILKIATRQMARKLNVIQESCTDEFNLVHCNSGDRKRVNLVRIVMTLREKRNIHCNSA